MFKNKIILSLSSVQLLQEAVYRVYKNSSDESITIDLVYKHDERNLELFPKVIANLVCSYLDFSMIFDVRVIWLNTCSCHFKSIGLKVYHKNVIIHEKDFDLDFDLYCFNNHKHIRGLFDKSLQMNEHYPLSFHYDIHTYDDRFDDIPKINNIIDTEQHSFILNCLNEYMKDYYSRFPYIKHNDTQNFSSAAYYSKDTFKIKDHILMRYFCIIVKVLIRNFDKIMKKLNYDLTKN